MDTTAAAPVFAFTASSATLTVAGVTVAGGFSISRSLEEGATVTRVSLTGATVTVGAGLLTLNNGSGSLVLGASGLAGTLHASVQVQPAGFALTGTLDVAVDTGAGTLTVGASDVTLTVGSIGGPTVRGDLTISRALASDGKVVLDVTIANAQPDLGPGLLAHPRRRHPARRDQDRRRDDVRRHAGRHRRRRGRRSHPRRHPRRLLRHRTDRRDAVVQRHRAHRLGLRPDLHRRRQRRPQRHRHHGHRLAAPASRSPAGSSRSPAAPPPSRSPPPAP